MSKDTFGDRMKRYENAFRHYLPGRMPVIIRIDGSHFHTYTKGLEKPFDEKLANAFWETCKYLLENISGAKLAYHQSDEISLLITNYDKEGTQSWFDNNLQKIVSVSASLATAKFNEEMRKVYPDKELATFDARAYVVPKEDVNNYFLWRERDAMKNSVSMLAQHHFSHKSLQGLNGKQMREKLLAEKGVDYMALPTWKRQGVVVKKETYPAIIENDHVGKMKVTRRRWAVDHDIPVFSEDWDYINQFVYLDEKLEVKA